MTNQTPAESFDLNNVTMDVAATPAAETALAAAEEVAVVSEADRAARLAQMQKDIAKAAEPFAEFVKEFDALDKPGRKALFAVFQRTMDCFPPAVTNQHPQWDLFLITRQKMEHFRGIKRSADGKIIRDRAYLENMIGVFSRSLLEAQAAAEQAQKNLTAAQEELAALKDK